MPQPIAHIADHELLLASERELPQARLVQVQLHVQECDVCRDRSVRLNGMLGDLATVYRAQSQESSALKLDPQILRGEARNSPRRHSRQVFGIGSLRDSFASWQWAAIPALVVMLLLAVQIRSWLQSKDVFTTAYQQPLPDLALTPGAIQTTDATAVCSEIATHVASGYPDTMRAQIFGEYRLRNARAQDYEIDYLITPELGGAADVRNLWPEPYSATAWNAHVKDQLENYLHDQVCRGNLELATAQHDISTNWISAYKKYFHTDVPLQPQSGTISN